MCFTHIFTEHVYECLCMCVCACVCGQCRRAKTFFHVLKLTNMVCTSYQIAALFDHSAWTSAEIRRIILTARQEPDVQAVQYYVGHSYIPDVRVFRNMVS